MERHITRPSPRCLRCRRALLAASPPDPAPAALDCLRLASSLAFLFCSVRMSTLVGSLRTTCCGAVSWSAMYAGGGAEKAAPGCTATSVPLRAAWRACGESERVLGGWQGAGRAAGRRARRGQREKGGGRAGAASSSAPRRQVVQETP